jgi:hypothetical protein
MLHFARNTRQILRAPLETPPLDDITTFAAWSVGRKLDSAYVGNCIQVRRSSDDTTANIGFDAQNVLDEIALLAFVGAGNGFIRTLYDQSGNGRDLVQTTNASQPRIVSSGVVDKMRGRPAAYFSNGPYMACASVAYAGTGWSMMCAVKHGATVQGWDAVWGWSSAQSQTEGAGFKIPIAGQDFLANDPIFYGDGWLTGREPRIIGTGSYLTDPYPVVWDGSLSASVTTLRRNGVGVTQRVAEVGTPDTETRSLTLGTNGTGGQFPWHGHIGEVILFNSEQDATLGDLRAGTMTFWRAQDPDAPVRGIEGLTGAYVNAGSGLNIEGTQPWTAIYSWYSTENTDSFGLIFCNVHATLRGYEVFHTSGGGVGVRVINTPITNWIDCGALVGGLNYSVCDGSPHVIMVSYDGSRTAAGVKIYIDGTLATTSVTTDNLNATSLVGGVDMLIGNQGELEDSFFMVGQLYRFDLAFVERDAAFAAAHATDATFPEADADSELHYEFAERTGTTTADDSANNFDGTLSTASLWI